MDFHSLQELKEFILNSPHLKETILSYLTHITQLSWQIFWQSLQDLRDLLVNSVLFRKAVELLEEYQQSQISPQTPVSNRTATVIARGVGTAHVST